MKEIKKQTKKKATEIKKDDYNASSIETKEGLEGVRECPGMYIGNIGILGVFHLFREVFDNSQDEYSEGYCTEILVDINEKTNQLTISDNGRGMPVEKIYDLAMKLHTSGKFKKDDGKGHKTAKNYKYSIGMHGVGLKTVNALSDKLVIIVSRNGKKYRTVFSKGNILEETKVIGKTNETGTYISFHPDKEVLKDIDLDQHMYYEYCENTSFLNKGLKIRYHATKRDDNKEVVKEFYNKEGLIDYVKHLEKHLITKPVQFEMEGDDKIVQLAIAYRKEDTETLYSFCNGLQTKDGGTHEAGFRQGLTNVILKYIKDKKLLNKKDENLEILGDDTREGMVAILVTKHPDPQFFGQTKDKLTSSDIRGICTKIVTDDFAKYLESNPEEAKKICLKVIQNAKGRVAAKRAKQAVAKKSEGFAALSSLSKFTSCSSNNPEECEIIIVEGDSAGGSADQGRDTKIQAIYKLKGKPLNTHDKDLIRVKANKEFNDLINILGCGSGNNFDITKLRYHKIIFATDADVDGYDIRSLLDTFFFKHATDLIVNGHVYHAQPPLYKIKEGKKEIYIRDKEEYNKYINKRIIKTFTLFVKGEDGKPEAIDKRNYNSLLNNGRKYLKVLDDLSSRLATKPDILEHVALYYGNSKFSKVMNSLGLKVTEGEEILVEGLHGEDYICLVIDEEVKSHISTIRKYFKKFGLNKFVCRNNDDKSKETMTVGSFLVKAFNECSPKHKTRYKGLGEMNADVLFDTTLNPEKRTLLQLSIDDFKLTDKEFEIQLGKNADKRKESMKGYSINVEDLDR